MKKLFLALLVLPMLIKASETDAPSVVASSASASSSELSQGARHDAKVAAGYRSDTHSALTDHLNNHEVINLIDAIDNADYTIDNELQENIDFKFVSRTTGNLTPKGEKYLKNLRLGLKEITYALSLLLKKPSDG
jgi:hypothetical protein